MLVPFQGDAQVALPWRDARPQGGCAHPRQVFRRGQVFLVSGGKYLTNRPTGTVSREDPRLSWAADGRSGVEDRRATTTRGAGWPPRPTTLKGGLRELLVDETTYVGAFILGTCEGRSPSVGGGTVRARTELFAILHRHQRFPAPSRSRPTASRRAQPAAAGRRQLRAREGRGEPARESRRIRRRLTVVRAGPQRKRQPALAGCLLR